MRIAAEDVIAVLGCASGNCINVNAACQELKNSAFDESPARSISLRSARVHCIATRAEQDFSRTNTAFCKERKHSYYIVLDLTLILYHAKEYEDEKEILRSKAKLGITHFHSWMHNGFNCA